MLKFNLFVWKKNLLLLNLFRSNNNEYKRGQMLFVDVHFVSVDITVCPHFNMVIEHHWFEYFEQFSTKFFDWIIKIIWNSFGFPHSAEPFFSLRRNYIEILFFSAWKLRLPPDNLFFFRKNKFHTWYWNSPFACWTFVYFYLPQSAQYLFRFGCLMLYYKCKHLAYV